MPKKRGWETLESTVRKGEEEGSLKRFKGQEEVIAQLSHIIDAMRAGTPVSSNIILLADR